MRLLMVQTLDLLCNAFQLLNFPHPTTEADLSFCSRQCYSFLIEPEARRVAKRKAYKAQCPALIAVETQIVQQDWQAH